MKRQSVVVGLVSLFLLVGLFVIVNAVADAGHTAAVDAARAHCAAMGWPSERLAVDKYSSSRGPFGSRAVIDFRVEGTDPPKVLRVELRKPMNVLGWQPTSIGEAPAREQG